MTPSSSVGAGVSTTHQKPSVQPATYKVPPVRFAFVHLNKPFDVAMVGQVIVATGHVEASLVGQGIGFNHPKVISRLESWNIQHPEELLRDKSKCYRTIDALKQENKTSRFVETVVEGGENPFRYKWRDDDIIVIGGANGLSKQDIEKMDALVTIPIPPEVEFLTVSTVVAVLGYHILGERLLWEKLEK